MSVLVASRHSSTFPVAPNALNGASGQLRGQAPSRGQRVGRLAAALSVALIVGFLPSVAASAAERDHRGEERDRRGEEHGRRGEEHGRRGPPRRRYPVYVPASGYRPAVVSPGISLVFPIVIR